MHLLLSQQIKSAALRGLLKTLDQNTIEEWIEDAEELESSKLAMTQVRLILKNPESLWRTSKFSFHIEDIMRQLGWEGWRREAIVNRVLREMCENGELVMLDEEIRHVYRCAAAPPAALQAACSRE